MDKILKEVDQEVNEMKKVFWALGLTMVFNAAGMAQKAKTPESDEQKPANVRSTNKNRKTEPKNDSAAFSVVSGLQAELQNTLDVKNARVGDQVILKTTQTVRQDGNVVIPKGTSLIGRVTEVQRRAKNGAGSKLGLVFDRLQGKELSAPISATIVSITDLRAANSLSSDTLNSDIMGSNTTSARSSAGGGSGGGLLGGVTNTVGGVLNTTTQTVGSVTSTATQTVGGTTQTVGRTLNGIQISSSANGSAQSSTTLTSPKGDVRLQKGVMFNLNVEKSGGN